MINRGYMFGEKFRLSISCDDYMVKPLSRNDIFVVLDKYLN